MLDQGSNFVIVQTSQECSVHKHIKLIDFMQAANLCASVSR